MRCGCGLQHAFSGSSRTSPEDASNRCPQHDSDTDTYNFFSECETEMKLQAAAIFGELPMDLIASRFLRHSSFIMGLSISRVEWSSQQRRGSR